MSLELLVPIENEALIGMTLLPKQILGKSIKQSSSQISYVTSYVTYAYIYIHYGVTYVEH